MPNRRFLSVRMTAAALVFSTFSMLAPASVHAGTYDDYFTAVKMDAPRELQDLIKRGLGPNMVEPQRGYSALMLSIREDSMKAFNVLFNTPGIDLEAKAKKLLDRAA